MSRDRYAARMVAQGYQRPSERPACCNCAHAAKVQGMVADLSRYEPLECRLGSFLIAPMGVCSRHAPSAVAALATARRSG